MLRHGGVEVLLVSEARMPPPPGCGHIVHILNHDRFGHRENPSLLPNLLFMTECVVSARPTLARELRPWTALRHLRVLSPPNVVLRQLGKRARGGLVVTGQRDALLAWAESVSRHRRLHPRPSPLEERTTGPTSSAKLRKWPQRAAMGPPLPSTLYTRVSRIWPIRSVRP